MGEKVLGDLSNPSCLSPLSPLAPNKAGIPRKGKSWEFADPQISARKWTPSLWEVPFAVGLMSLRLWAGLKSRVHIS